MYIVCTCTCVYVWQCPHTRQNTCKEGILGIPVSHPMGFSSMAPVARDTGPTVMPSLRSAPLQLLALPSVPPVEDVL